MSRFARLAALAVIAAPATGWTLPPKSPAAELAGRTAGAPVDCLPPRAGDRGGGVYASGDILYRGPGSRIYVNHPPGCAGLDSDRIIVTRSPSSRLCRGDIFEVRDRFSPVAYGSCALGSFVPYDKPKR